MSWRDKDTMAFFPGLSMGCEKILWAAKAFTSGRDPLVLNHVVLILLYCYLTLTLLYITTLDS